MNKNQPMRIVQLLATAGLAVAACSPASIPVERSSPSTVPIVSPTIPSATLKLPTGFPPQVFGNQTVSKGGRTVSVQAQSGSQDIWVTNMDGSTTPISLTTNPANDYSPAWSPDGLHIAFVSERDNNPEIYVMNADGTAQTRLTNNAVRDTLPVWSPDGQLIAFISNRDEQAELYVMQADGTAQTRLTHDGVYEFGPALSWSTDGQLLAYLSVQAEQIYLIKPDGTGQMSYIDFMVPDKSILRYDPQGRKRNCGAFQTQAEAQAFFIVAGGPLSDRHELDSGGVPGLACESLP